MAAGTAQDVGRVIIVAIAVVADFSLDSPVRWRRLSGIDGRALRK